jgi:hypothetical protein
MISLRGRNYVLKHLLDDIRASGCPEINAWLHKNDVNRRQ